MVFMHGMLTVFWHAQRGMFALSSEGLLVLCGPSGYGKIRQMDKKDKHVD